MNTTTDRADIETLLQKLASAHADHDVDAIVEAYAPDAVIFDLAPPLPAFRSFGHMRGRLMIAT